MTRSCLISFQSAKKWLIYELLCAHKWVIQILSLSHMPIFESFISRVLIFISALSLINFLFFRTKFNSYCPTSVIFPDGTTTTPVRSITTMSPGSVLSSITFPCFARFTPSHGVLRRFCKIVRANPAARFWDGSLGWSPSTLPRFKPSPSMACQIGHNGIDIVCQCLIHLDKNFFARRHIARYEMWLNNLSGKWFPHVLISSIWFVIFSRSLSCTPPSLSAPQPWPGCPSVFSVLIVTPACGENPIKKGNEGITFCYQGFSPYSSLLNSSLPFTPPYFRSFFVCLQNYIISFR